jgi:hypothetical protein
VACLRSGQGWRMRGRGSGNFWRNASSFDGFHRAR